MAKIVVDREIDTLGNKFRVWWSYYWRYLVLFPALAFGGSYLVSYVLVKTRNAGFVPLGNVSVTMFFNALVSLAVIWFILGRSYGQFKYSPVRVGDGKDSGNASCCETGKSFAVAFRVWSSFFWRFLILAGLIGFCMGYAASFITGYFNLAGLGAFRNYSYLGNIASLPASVLAFWAIIGRKYRGFAAVLLPER